MTEKRTPGRSDQGGRKKSRREFCIEHLEKETFQEGKGRANPEERLGKRKLKK